VTARLEAASLRLAQQPGREIRHLHSAPQRQEDIAREIAARDDIREGLIGVRRRVDSWTSLQIHKNHQTRQIVNSYGPLYGVGSRGAGVGITLANI
jgi:hypothetical protein